MSLKKKSIIPLNFSMALLVPSQKINMSSTKSRCLMLHDAPIDTPLRLPFIFSSLISLLKHSSININRRGDRCHPYLRDLPNWKKGDDTPFINTTKYIDYMKLIIHTMN